MTVDNAGASAEADGRLDLQGSPHGAAKRNPAVLQSVVQHDVPSVPPLTSLFHAGLSAPPFLEASPSFSARLKSCRSHTVSPCHCTVHRRFTSRFWPCTPVPVQSAFAIPICSSSNCVSICADAASAIPSPKVPLCAACPANPKPCPNRKIPSKSPAKFVWAHRP